jgi:hypothetical protein
MSSPSSIKGSGAELFVRWVTDHLGSATVDLDAKVTPDGRIVCCNTLLRHPRVPATASLTLFV